MKGRWGEGNGGEIGGGKRYREGKKLEKMSIHIHTYTHIYMHTHKIQLQSPISLFFSPSFPSLLPLPLPLLPSSSSWTWEEIEPGNFHRISLALLLVSETFKKNGWEIMAREKWGRENEQVKSQGKGVDTSKVERRKGNGRKVRGREESNEREREKQRQEGKKKRREF